MNYKETFVDSSYPHTVRIPSQWVFTPLNNAIQIIGGSQPPKSEFSATQKEGYIRLIQIRDYKTDANKVYIPKIKARRFASVDDVMIGRYGPPIFQILRGLEGAYNVALMKAAPVAGVIDNQYLFFYLQNRDLFNYVEAASDRTAGQSGVNKTHLEKYPVALPPLAEQKVIAEKLDTLLARVETTKARLDRIPNILKTFRQSVLAAAVSGKLTEEWRKENVLSKPKEIQLGKIVGEGPQNGLYKSQSFYGQGIRIIRIDGFYDGEIVDWNNIKRLSLDDSEYSRWKLEIGDILVNRVNSIEYLGKSAIVRELPEPAVFESNIMKFRVNPDEAIPDYIVKFLCSISGLSQLRKNAKLAVNQASINQQDVKNCIIFLPEISEQTEIVRRVEELFAFADNIEQKTNTALERVNNLTQSILAKAFRGELTADWRAENPDLISGENSAEALLAKIQAEREKLALEKKAANKTRKKKA